ncbi:MAG: hypothetical protein ACJAU7_001299 [Parvibaculaceae bacterium]
MVSDIYRSAITTKVGEGTPTCSRTLATAEKQRTALLTYTLCDACYLLPTIYVEALEAETFDTKTQTALATPA